MSTKETSAHPTTPRDLEKQLPNRSVWSRYTLECREMCRTSPLTTLTDAKSSKLREWITLSRRRTNLVSQLLPTTFTKVSTLHQSESPSVRVTNAFITGLKQLITVPSPLARWLPTVCTQKNSSMLLEEVLKKSKKFRKCMLRLMATTNPENKSRETTTGLVTPESEMAKVKPYTTPLVSVKKNFLTELNKL